MLSFAVPSTPYVRTRTEYGEVLLVASMYIYIYIYIYVHVHVCGMCGGGRKLGLIKLELGIGE